MEPTIEFEQLLADLLDGSLDDARRVRLNELLRAHPALRDDYLDHLQVHSLLQWRDLADALLENSAWLARNDDPIAAADRFNDIADQVVARMSTSGEDPQRVAKLASVYTRLSDQGIDRNLDRAFESGSLSAEQ